MRSRGRSRLAALCWAAAVTGAEGIARRRLSDRSRAWLASYAILGVAGGVALAGGGRTLDPPAKRRSDVPLGLGLAAIGYPVGRALLGDRPTEPPREGWALETLALAGVVAPVEELVWGGLVEPALGIPATSALFATKHIVLDGRVKRWLGLALFGVGLGLLRRRSRPMAALVHVACNAGGVAFGHLTGRDQF